MNFSGNTDSTANRQWASRPADQRFLSVPALKRYLKDRTGHAHTLITQTNRLDVTASAGDDIQVETEFGVHRMTNWSFGQLVQQSALATKGGGRVSPRAEWLRAAEAPMAAAVLQYGFMQRDDHEEIALLSQFGVGEPVPTMRAITSKDYGRIWDVDVVENLVGLGETWHVPAEFGPTGNRYEDMTPEQQHRATTLYASDRDLFVFLVDEEHPIEVRLDSGESEALYRGFYLWNSEVGNLTWGLDTFLYRFVCMNRNVWGVQEKKSFTIRHTKGAPTRFRYEGVRMLQDYASQSPQEEQARILRASRLELGSKKEDVVEFLRKRGFGPQQAGRMYDRADQEGNPRTVWNLVQAGTAMARDIEHTDNRIEQERKASSLMDLVAS